MQETIDRFVNEVNNFTNQIARKIPVFQYFAITFF